MHRPFELSLDFILVASIIVCVVVVVFVVIFVVVVVVDLHLQSGFDL